MHIRFHMRQRRSAKREENMDDSQRGSPIAAAAGQLPDEAAVFAEHLHLIMQQLNEQECQLIELKMQDYESAKYLFPGTSIRGYKWSEHRPER
jgi:hypothetical protein